MFNVQIEPTIVKTLVGRSRDEVSGVDTAGVVCELAISKNAKITQLQVRHTAGAGAFSVNMFSDAALTDEIFSALSDEGSNRFMLNKMDLDFQNTNNPQSNLCYLKLTPNAGEGHSFIVALFYEKQ